MPVYQRQPQGAAMQGVLDLLPDWLSKAITEPSIGDVMPGPMGMASKAEGPLFRLLEKLGFKVAPGENLGDLALREHVLGSPRLREFLPVGEEGAQMAAPGAKGMDPRQAAYERILNGTGKVKASPPGSGPKVETTTTSWPSEADIERLKVKYEGDVPKRRKLPSGRPLDPDK